MVSVPLMRCSSEAVAIMLPESFISSRADNKCNFLKEVLGGLVWFGVLFPMLQLALIHSSGGGILKSLKLLLLQ